MQRKQERWLTLRTFRCFTESLLLSASDTMTVADLTTTNLNRLSNQYHNIFVTIFYNFVVEALCRDEAFCL